MRLITLLKAPLILIACLGSVTAFALAPTLNSVTPNSSTTTAPQGVTITGSNIQAGATASIIDGSSILLSGYDTPDYVYDVEVSGNYMFVADGNTGVLVLDISDATNPVLVNTYVSGTSLRGLTVVDQYLYVGEYFVGTTNILILDISDPTNPTLANTLATGYVGTAYDFHRIGNTLYVAGGNSGMHILDVTNPGSPVLMSSYKVPSTANYADGIYISGNYAYVADYYKGLYVINISDPYNPVLADTVTLPFGFDVEVKGNTAFVAGQDGLYAFDITDPTNLVQTDLYDIVGYGHHVSIVGNLAYVSGDHSGVRLIDISNRTSLKPVGHVAADNMNAWTRSLRVRGGRLYIAYGGIGVQIHDIRNMKMPSLAGEYRIVGNAYDVRKIGNIAYIAYYASGLYTVDVSNPANPVLLGSYNTPDTARGIDVVGNYAYVANSNTGLMIFDVTNPAAPALVSTLNTPGSALDVKVAGNTAYVADYGSGLRIIDISNPALPVEVGFYDTPGLSMNVTLSGNLVFVADYTDMRIINVSNPAAPAQVGTVATPGRAQSVALYNNFAFVADGDFGIQMVDISNPALPAIVNNFATPGFATYAKVVGTTMYTLDAKSGLFSVDISNLLDPVLTGSYDTAGYANSVDVDAGYAYVADGEGGLQVVALHPAVTSAVLSGSSMSATVPAGLPQGSYHVIATNPDGLLDAGIVANGYFINVGTPMGDQDSDLIFDALDNCLVTANNLQRDTNGDGYGNSCDADITDDLTVDAADLGKLLPWLALNIDHGDFNGDGAVDSLDIGIMMSSYNGTPGPSSLTP